MTTRRVTRTALPSLALVTATAAVLLVAAPADGAPGRPSPGVALSADPGAIDVIPLPCFPGGFRATMTNTGSKARFADMTLTADAPLTLSRDVFSSYLPAADPDQPVSVPVEVRAPRDTTPGSYDVELEVERQRLRVPVNVEEAPAKGPGDNLALGEEAFASSTHGNFTLCGGVDGNTNQADWDTRTGWNDGTPAVFPDTYGVRFPEARQVDEVKLLTLDSAAYPAARYGLKDWDVQVLSGGSGGEWRTAAEVRGNTAGLVTTRFDATTAEAVRILVRNTNDARYSRVMEMEVRGG